MAGTKIVAVRAAVLTGIGGLTAFAAVPHVDLTWKKGVREQAFTTRAAFRQEPASMKAGRTFRDEEGTFNLVILIQAVGKEKDAQWAAERAVTLGVAAEEWIADHRTTTGVAGVNWVTVTGAGSLTELYGDRSSIAELIYPVRYTARLT